MSRAAAARAAQSTLANGGLRLKIDGIWGKRSQAAYDSAPESLQAKADSAAMAYGYAIHQLSDKGSWIAEPEVDRIVRAVAPLTGRSVELTWSFIRLEAATKMVSGVRYFNAASVAPSGLYHGLMQMGRPAWDDVRKSYPGTPAFIEGRYDPTANILAGLRYSVLNERTLRTLGYRGPFTVEVMYAAHNQGASGFMSLLKNKRVTRNFSVQSAKAKSVIKTALASNGVALG